MNIFRKTSKDDTTRVIMLSPKDIYVSPRIRRIFNETKLRELALSIRQNGVVQPIGVSEMKNGGFELIYGERRLKASIMANLHQIPCMVLPSSENHLLFSMIENLQREDLSFFEQADGIYSLISEFNMTRREVSEKLGLSESAVSNKLRLLRLTRAQRESIENMNLTERHARTLLRICDDKLRTSALREIIDRSMNVEEAEHFVDRLLMPKTQKQRPKLIIKDIRLFVNSINKAINVMRVSGIQASSSREEDENYIKYTVLIPKQPNDLSNDNIKQLPNITQFTENSAM